MPAISEGDWGRIYAFIWKKYQDGDPSYKEEFEKNPKMAIDRIKGAIHPPLNNYTTLFDISPLPGDLGATLDEIIEGKAIAFLQTRLTC